MPNNEEELEHYGVKGMKWGVRRAAQAYGRSARDTAQFVGGAAKGAARLHMTNAKNSKRVYGSAAQAYGRSARDTAQFVGGAAKGGGRIAVAGARAAASRLPAVRISPKAKARALSSENISVGRQIMATILGGAVGGMAGGPLGAGVGLATGAAIENAAHRMLRNRLLNED